MTIRFERKFTERDLDTFLDRIFKNYKRNPKDHYFFDCTELEWISNQELLVFTSLIKYFVQKDINFEILFFKKGIPFEEIDIRVARQLVQIWEVWRIWSVIPQDRISNIFGIDGNAIAQLKKFHKIRSGSNEIYSRYGITPFVSLEKIANYNDHDIEEILNQFYVLNDVTKEVVYNNHCEHPFVNETLSHIVSKELYENFLDHFKNSFFESNENWAFMSLSLKTQMNEHVLSPEFIQKIHNENFADEALPEFKRFYFDEVKKVFRNRSFLQFSFLDFGDGIAETLKDEYTSKNEQVNDLFTSDSAVLKFAFQHDSSRHPIKKRINLKENYIPRGLFDILSIVQRYEGLLVARSNYGKILYDFTGGKTIGEAFSTFGNERLYFPGTLISIYLPAISIGKSPDISTIKPVIQKPSYLSPVKHYINVYHIINSLKSEKKDIYSDLVFELKRQMKNEGLERVTYFNFRGYEQDKGLTKKVIFFLLADYEINLNNNVVVINPPALEVMKDVNEEILSLSNVIKTYKVHPLPLIYYDEQTDELSLFWLGVYDQTDQNLLDQLLLEQFSLSKEDFNEPSNISGHLNYFDSPGNLHSMMPKRTELLEFYKDEYETADHQVVKDILFRNGCLKAPGDSHLYLCNGNYYQYQFIDLIRVLNTPNDCNLIAEILFRKIINVFKDITNYRIVGITSSSHKLIASLVKQQFIDEDATVLLDNYHSFDEDEKFKKITKDQRFILFCDVISTGYLTNKLANRLNLLGAELAGVAVIVDTIDDIFEDSATFKQNISFKLVSLHENPIKKYRRDHPQIKSDLKTKEVIRINPFTNLPITLSIKDTVDGKILLSNDQFLENIQDEHIKIGYLKFNNVIHPYFFDTKSIIKNISAEFLRLLFGKIRIKYNELKIFYPKNSGMRYLDNDMLKNIILRDQSIEVYELERFNTLEGWKFPHTTDDFSILVNEKNILIMDDGSCSGDSLVQMVDELALLGAKEIIVLSLIGRVDDHKREFFSRITQLMNNKNYPVRLTIYFGSHWHIPTYYFDNNPVSRERAWLEEVSELQNTPEAIKRIARTIFKELTPKPFDDLKDYKYMPRIRGSADHVIPKKNIIKAREEIGKVIGYRFYRESFDYFNEFIKKYESSDKYERNKEMELLCSTFLFEPYLYDKIAQLMPDVVDKIEEFIDALIFGNPKKRHRRINLNTELSYNWDKKDIIHLFFIVFKKDKLIKKLIDTTVFKKLIDFVSDVDSAINYILYKLLAYFPVNKTSFNSGNSGHFLHLLDISLQENLFTDMMSKEVKIFRSFVGTLRCDDDYYSQLAVIKNNYRKLTDSVLHKESIMVHHDVMLVELQVLAQEFDEVTKERFQESWLEIARFIESMLSFSRSYPGFFINHLDSMEGKTEFTLRTIHGRLNELVNNINPESEFGKIETYLNKLGYKFLRSEGDIFKIFNKVSTSNALLCLHSLAVDRKIDGDIDIDQGNVEEDVSLDIPHFFYVSVILEEVITNLRHRDKRQKIKISYSAHENYLIINIKNKVGTNVNHGGGNGLYLLEAVNKFPNKIVHYSNNIKAHLPYFEQTLKIKIV